MEVRNIFFDMDEVLADFSRGVREIVGTEPPPQDGKHKSEEDKMWAGIRDAGHFYDRLEPVSGAVDLFNELYSKYGDKCEILTAVPKPKRNIPEAGDDKKKWVKRLLSDKVKVNIVTREEKPEFCKGKDCILIDDLPGNIGDWESTGGTGILFTDAESIYNILHELGVL